MDLIGLTVNDLKRTVSLDQEQFDKYYPFEPAPKFYSEYIFFCPFLKHIPDGLSLQQAIAYVNSLPMIKQIKARWFTTPFSEVYFHRDDEISINLFRPSMEHVQGDKVIFGGHNRINHSIRIGGKDAGFLFGGIFSE